ncbi:MAG: GvpL/GvpF family gas vesicle protein [Candidatus Methylomirabilales bacterium]
MRTGGSELQEVPIREGSPHEPVPHPDDSWRRNGRYLYCVAEGGERRELGPIGVEGNPVYTIPHRHLCAVVHDCPAAPYRSEDEGVVHGWLRAHEAVVEAAWGIFGTVLPSGFDTIVRAAKDRGPTENVEWLLKERHDVLLEKISKVRGKAEYGVQISWDARQMAARVVGEAPAIRELDEEMRSKSPGTAYLYKQKLDKAIRAEMEARADVRFKDFYNRIKAWVADLRVERAKPPEGDRQMLMNLSCLVRKEDVAGLGGVLEKIQGMDGFSVRFTGPWPPYSFVAPG